MRAELLGIDCDAVNLIAHCVSVKLIKIENCCRYEFLGVAVIRNMAAFGVSRHALSIRLSSITISFMCSRIISACGASESSQFLTDSPQPFLK